MNKATILSSFLEPPKEINSDLHPSKPWVLTAVDNGESNMITAAIYDYKNKRTIVTLGINTSLPQPVSPFASVGTHHTTYANPKAANTPAGSTSDSSTIGAYPNILMATNTPDTKAASNDAADTSENETSRKAHLRNTISFGNKANPLSTIGKQGSIWCGADIFATEYGLTAASLLGIDCPENAAQIPTNTFIYPTNTKSNCMTGTMTSDADGNKTEKASERALARGAPFLPTPGSLDLTSGVYRDTSGNTSDASSPAVGQSAGVQKACGNLRLAKFYDSYVRSYKSVIEMQTELQRSGTETKLSNEMKFDCCGNYGVLVFDYRVVFVDYVTMKTREITYSDMKTFQITSLEVFSKYRFIAFGCSDGNIRLFDTERWAFFKVLSGGHKQNSSVTKLLSLVRDDVTWLLSLGSDGAMAVWDVDAGTLEKTFPEAHEGGVYDVTFDSSSGRIFTYGADKSLVEWGYGDVTSGDDGDNDDDDENAGDDVSDDVDEDSKKKKKDKKKKEKDTGKKKKVESIDTGKAPFKEISRNFVKTGKSTVMGFTFIEHPDFIPGSFVCFRPDTAEVFVSDPTFTASRKVFSVGDVKIVSPIALKRAPRIYSVAVHPLQKNVIVVVSSRGTFLIKIPYTHPPNCVITKQERAGGKKESVVYYDRDNNIYYSSLLHKSKEHKIGITLPEGTNNFTLKFNKSSTHCLIEFNDLHTYKVYKIVGPHKIKWKLIKEGSFLGESIAVSNKEDKFAFVEPPGEDNSAKRYVIRTFDDDQRTVYEQPEPDREIERLYGGQLVGVQYVPTDPKDTAVFQFYSWSGLNDKHKVGNGLNSPNSVVWDPLRQCVAMLYDEFVNIYSVRDDKDKESQRLSLDFTFKVSGSISLFWDFSLVYISTFDDIRCYFLNNQMSHLILASQKEDNNVTEEDTPLISLSKPLGPLHLFAHINEKLFAVDCEKNIFKFPLNSPYLSCCKMLTVKDPTEAMKFVPRIHPKFHKHLSILFATCGFYDEVMKIPGLDPWFKLKFCIKNCVLNDSTLPILQRVVKDTLRSFALPPSSIPDSNVPNGSPVALSTSLASPRSLSSRSLSSPSSSNLLLQAKKSSTAEEKVFAPGLKRNLKYAFKEVIEAAEVLAEYSRVKKEDESDDEDDDEDKDGDAEVDAEVGAGFIRAVMPLDTNRAYYLLICHYAALGKKKELEKVREEMKGLKNAEDPGMKTNIMFCSKCLGK